MNKRELKKAAYSAIVRDGLSHQEAFNRLRKDSEIEIETLAEEVSKIPSANKNNATQVWRYIYTLLLVLIIGLRSASLFLMAQLENISSSVVFLGIVLGLFVPVLGIVAAFTSRVELYKTVGILLTLSILRSFSNGFEVDPIFLLTLLPFALAAGLSFYIPSLLKTPFTKKIDKKDSNGSLKSSVNYVFDSSSANEELLDSAV